MRPFLFRSLSLLLGAAPLAQQPTLPAVAALLADRPATGPGVVVAVARDGELLHAQATGRADVERDTPMTVDTAVYLASVSKQFTAACVVQLAAAGKLALTDPARKHLPQLPACADGVTIAHLLHHRSGLHDFFEVMSLARRDLTAAVTPAEVFTQIGRQQQLDFPPGRDFVYSNTNYFALAEIVRAVTGRSLRDHAANDLFAPLGMRRSWFQDGPDQAQDPVAVGHEGGTPPRPMRTAFALPGSGGMYSTVGDLLLWLRNFDTATWGGKELVRQLVTPPALHGDQRQAADLGPYAAGLMVQEHGGRPIVWHAGGSFGCKTCVVRVPAERLHVVVLGNSSALDADGLAFAILDAVLPPLPAPPAPEPAARSKGFHVYQDPTGELAIVSWRDGGRGFLTTLSAKVPILAGAGGGFIGATPSQRVRGSENGGVLTFRVGDGQPSSGVAIRPTPVEAEALAALAGEWQCAEAAATVTLQVRAGRLTLDDTGMGRRVAPFQPLGPDLFLSDTGVRLDVERTADGQVRRLLLSTPRARRLELVRG